jgi:hypothetical protein
LECRATTSQQIDDVEVVEVSSDHIDFLHLDGLTPVVRGLGRVNR